MVGGAVRSSFPSKNSPVAPAFHSLNHTPHLHSIYYPLSPYNTVKMAKGDVDQAKKSFMGMPVSYRSFLSMDRLQTACIFLEQR